MAAGTAGLAAPGLATATAGGVTAKRAVVSSPAFASSMGTEAGSTRQPAGTGRLTLAFTPSLDARTRSATGAGFPFNDIAALRSGVTVAGGATSTSRRRSPRVGSVHAYTTGRWRSIVPVFPARLKVTTSGAGSRGWPARGLSPDSFSQ